MGSYLSEPIVEKASEDGADDTLSYGVSDMQGWRKNMEDAHITDLDTAGGGAGPRIFAVFDGHGGKEVAHFCKHHFPVEARAHPGFRRGEFESALPQLFHRMDEMLRDDATYGSELKEYARIGKSGAEAGGGAMTAVAESPPETKEEMEASIKAKMDEAEVKGSLSKQEAIELMMQMMQLKKITQQQGGAAGAAATSGGGAGEGAAGAAAAASAPTPARLPCEAGCTAVVAVLSGRELYVANAGDSRGVICRAGGKAQALSYDHKPRDPVELKRIEDAGGYVNNVGRINGNLNLSRSIGDLRYKQDVTISAASQIITAQPDVTRTTLREDDEFMVLACDGVWDIMSNQGAVDFVRERIRNGVAPLSKIAEEVMDACICEDPGKTQGIGGDNMTCMVVCFQPALFAA